MSLRFTVLASGSQGNASLVQAGDFGVLIDCGLGPRTLATRLERAELSWQHVNAMLLTHTHSDHWRERTLFRLSQLGIPLYCHSGHHGSLAMSEAFALLKSSNLVRPFQTKKCLQLTRTLCCYPLRVRHDSGYTFGFRFEGGAEAFGPSSSLAYLADLGTWDADLAEAAADVELLALEFNHDVEMERSSGRMPYLIKRILGDRGHLSNVQAAEFLKEVLKRSSPGRLRRVVQLHLSQDCNCPNMAAEAARSALAEAESGAEVFTAGQHDTSPCFPLSSNGFRPFSQRRTKTRASRSKTSMLLHPNLPGFDLD